MATETTVGRLLKEVGGDIQTGPFGTKLKAAEYTADGVPVISVGEVGYGRLRTHPRTPRVDESVTNRMPEYLLKAGDIVFGRKGAVDRSALVLPEQEGWFLGSDGIRLRLPECCDARFIAYQLQTPRHREWIIRHAAGTTMPSLNESIIRDIPLVLPSLVEQRAIASVLSALDDMIAQNQRTAKVLERLAKAIFRAWFIDFEPVKAKAEGAKCFPSMPQNVFDTLPTNFVNSEIGLVPEGWRVKTIEEVVTVKGGGTPSTTNPAYWDEGVHNWATPKDLSRLLHPILLDTERRITDTGVAAISSGLLPVGTVLMSSRAPVGYLAIAGVPTAINQGFIAMICDRTLPPIYVLNWAFASMDTIKARSSGTTFEEISKKDFRPILIVEPHGDAIAGYQRVAEPLFELLTICVRANKRLAAMRDYLLPHLLSGAVRVEAANV